MKKSDFAFSPSFYHLNFMSLWLRFFFGESQKHASDEERAREMLLKIKLFMVISEKHFNF